MQEVVGGRRGQYPNAKREGCRCWWLLIKTASEFLEPLLVMACNCNKPLGRSGHAELWGCGGTRLGAQLFASNKYQASGQSSFKDSC